MGTSRSALGSLALLALTTTACGLTGSTHRSTQGIGADLPIQYIFVLVKENHTFDSYFTDFPGAQSSETATLSSGQVIQRPLAPDSFPRGVCHTYDCALTAFDYGANDGFDLIPGSSPPPYLFWQMDQANFVRYTEAQIPNYWSYARNFVLADHFFSTVMGPSFPGHFAVENGWSPALDNPTCNSSGGCLGGCTVEVYDPQTGATRQDTACWDAPSLTQELPQGFDWADYGWDISMYLKSVSQQPDAGAHVKDISQLLPDLHSGNYPHLIFAHVEDGTLSEHPPGSVCPGENYSVQLINAIMSGPHWNESAILLTWDDWGGFYDSVPPPASPWPNGSFIGPGFRLPLIIISPFAKQGYVLSAPTEQASVPRLIEDLWGMPRLGDLDPRVRDTQVGSLLDAFDFTQPPRSPLLLAPRQCP